MTAQNETKTGAKIMTAFDHFQFATCHIAERKFDAAIKELSAAIVKIDGNGVDAEMRPDLISLMHKLANKCAP